MPPRGTLGLYSHPLENSRSQNTWNVSEYCELKSLKMSMHVISAQRLARYSSVLVRSDA
jgi:hypothetical protein